MRSGEEEDFGVGGGGGCSLFVEGTWSVDSGMIGRIAVGYGKYYVTGGR